MLMRPPPEKVGADVRSLQDASYEAQLTGMAVWMMLPLVLALVDPAVRIVGDAGQQSAVDGGGGWLRGVTRCTGYSTGRPH